MGIQFRLTVAEDRIELEQGACSIVLDRTRALEIDYHNAAGAAGSEALYNLLLSMAPAVADDESLDETPLEEHIRQLKSCDTPLVMALAGDTNAHVKLDIVSDQTAHVKFDRARWARQAKATRMKAGDSQEAIGKAVGVPGNTISMMETGSKNMADVTAIDIARRVISHYSSAANEKPLPTRFGAVLRAARKAKHLTTDALGEQVGLSRNYILKIEKDPFAGAPRATVERIATRLGVKNVERFYREREAA